VRAEGTAASAPALGGRRRVVLIEDDPDIAEAITYQLHKAGLDVRVARAPLAGGQIELEVRIALGRRRYRDGPAGSGCGARAARSGSARRRRK